MDDLAARRLSALERVAGLLDARAIDYWLFGGWAVDFYAGSVTRPHDDVDIAVWLDDVPRIVSLLGSQGWRHPPAEDEDGGTGYERDGVRLELTYLVRNDERDVFVPLRDGPVPWDGASFADDERMLSGVHSRLITLASLKSMKVWTRDDPGDAAKDRADLDVLGGA